MPLGAMRGVECSAIGENYEMSETLASENSSSLPRSTESSSPFEVEPGHFDFLQVAGTFSSKQYSSDSSLAKGSTKGDSSSSVRRHSNQSASSSSSLGNPKRGEGLAIEYAGESGRIEAFNRCSKPNLGEVGARPSRADGQPSRSVAQPCQVSAHPFLTEYSWNQVAAMTRAANYKILGKGGFGPVYLGILPSNKQVAVKVLDYHSRQGHSEFLNEVELLSRVNHVNLVKLVGYCNDELEKVLVYEHAEQGTLWDHIRGNESNLDWRTRLKVSLDSACGLEYLHTGCSPKIIHRDIKSSNILLTKHFVAKVADFGLSKIGVEDENDNQTHMSTAVRGTLGYLDPEYYKSGQLNEKSDIYSFGVVLLELITGRNPIEKDADPKCIGDWVKVKWKSCGGAKGVADSSLGGAYNLKSMTTVVTLALKCLELSAKKRPDIRVVVEQLRAAIALEDNTGQASKWSLRSLLGQS